jgi:rubrerythrin/ElaB/YqjD/DUF883 family membrane-anchored ribosome-binding protein
VETDLTRGAGGRMAPTEEVIKGLNDLLQLDHDAIGAYEIAIERLEDRDAADQIAGFKHDHERHIRSLTDLVTELGGQPKNEPHATGPFKEALQRLGAVAGDKGILLSFRANELQVRMKYDRYASKAVFWPSDAKRVVDENALDEERHYQWVADLLQRMGVAPGEGLEIDVATRMREGVRQVGPRAEAAASQARNRIAGALESMAHNLDEMAPEGVEGPRARVGDAVHRLAGGIESTAEYVRSGDVERLREVVEDGVRRRPAQAILASVAVGFVIGRLLR